MLCPRCQASLPSNTARCTRCGEEVGHPVENGADSAALSRPAGQGRPTSVVLLAAAVPGLGHIRTGRTATGAAIALLFFGSIAGIVVLWLGTALAIPSRPDAPSILGGFLGAFFWIVVLAFFLSALYILQLIDASDLDGAPRGGR